MKTIWTALAALMMTTASYACSCPPITNVIYHVASSDEIFIGRCISGNLTGQSVVFEFDQIRNLMGPQRSTATVETHKEGSMCGYEFIIGDEYLIYCFSISGQLWTDICRPTKRLEVTNAQKAEIAEIVNVQTNQASQEMLHKLRMINKNPQPAGGAYVSPAAGDPSAHP
jgi:hypothetical protein